MGNLRRFYYQNKITIWKTILIIALILGIIQLLNFWAKQNSTKTSNSVNNTSLNVNISNHNNSYISNSSIVSGNKITEEQAESINSTINKFLDYCNNKEVSKAYEMLSSNCKESLYPTEERFANEYCLKNFQGDNVFTIENWIGDTYKIKIQQNSLTTGKIDNTAIQDYITIVKEDAQDKLNINSYIRKQNIDKVVQEKSIIVNIKSKETYMDYEIYNIEITNQTGYTIMLDDLQGETIYLLDKNDNKYNAFIHELSLNNMIIRNNYTNKISIKFASAYTSKKSIQNLVFSKIILNYGNQQQQSKYEIKVNI